MNFYTISEIKKRMTEKNLSIMELARRLDLPYQTVYRIIKEDVDIDKVTLRIYKKIVRELWKEV